MCNKNREIVEILGLHDGSWSRGLARARAATICRGDRNGRGESFPPPLEARLVSALDLDPAPWDPRPRAQERMIVNHGALYKPNIDMY